MVLCEFHYRETLREQFFFFLSFFLINEMISVSFFLAGVKNTHKNVKVSQEVLNIYMDPAS